MKTSANLLEIAATWLGTPFFPGASLKGHGVDCVHLVEEILIEAEWIPRGYRFPPYRIDGGQHLDRSPLEAWLDDRPERFRRLDLEVEGIREGDLLCFRMGRIAYHLGLALGPWRFVHAAQHRGVKISSLRDSTFSKRLASAYRLQ